MISRTWLQMGMPVSVSICDAQATTADIDAVEAWFELVNQRFSTYLPGSEISRFNAGRLAAKALSADAQEVLDLSETTRRDTGGYFDIRRGTGVDPSGLVKGWAIAKASDLLCRRDLHHHVVDAGGDVQATGRNPDGGPWRVGIRSPFDREKNVKVLEISDLGVATSGISIRGAHIYDPLTGRPPETDLVSLTVVARSIYDADRFATAAFAMGDRGLSFLVQCPQLDGFEITSDGMSRSTNGLQRYVR